MRKTIEDRVERGQARKRLMQDTIAAWHDYQQTGLHLTAEEADAWLAKLEAGKNVAAPECHQKTVSAIAGEPWLHGLSA
jgi:predicted transcriptional regulator